MDGEGGSACAIGPGAPSTDNQSLLTMCFLVFSLSLAINGSRGMESQGLLWVETIAANSPSVIPLKGCFRCCIVTAMARNLEKVDL
jgi:hypothetical protein